MKKYVKPTFEIVQLSMEERLACSTNKVSHTCGWPCYPGYSHYYNPWGGWFYAPYNASQSWWYAFWKHLKWW